MSEHILNTQVRPPACSCGRFQAAGSPTFVREQFALHVSDADEAQR